MRLTATQVPLYDGDLTSLRPGKSGRVAILRRLLFSGLMGWACFLGSPQDLVCAKPWSIDYESSLQTTNNLQQDAAGTPDLAFRNTLEFTYAPPTGQDDSALFRFEVLDQRYVVNPDFNSTYLVGTAIASHRLLDSTYAYGGYQFLYKQSDTLSNISRMDNDLFAGAVAYNPLGSSRILLHGYQFDFLRAADVATSYQGHSLYVTYKELTTDRWTNAATLRSQLRYFDAIGAFQWLNFVIGESDYQMNDWWSLRAECIATFSGASTQNFRYNGYDLAAYTRFSF
jgi:hypothetical protein